jgi:hypothetical protein
MAKAKKEGPSRARTAGGQKLGDFAVDLGRLLGKTQARAQVWMKQREAIAGQLAHVRDTASSPRRVWRGAAFGARAAGRALLLLQTPAAYARRDTHRDSPPPSARRSRDG